jgi:hypothetical protein
MNKRGPIVSFTGIAIVGISFFLMMSVIPSSFVDSANFSVPSMFEGMFNEVSHEIPIMSGDSANVSYSTFSSDIPLLWGIQIIDYKFGDKLSVHISNIFGDSYGEFIQDEFILFEVLQIQQSDTLNFEIQNLGSQNIIVVVMFSEDPENSDAFSNPNSTVRNMVYPLAISGIMMILGILISILGGIIFIVDWKNIRDKKRNY